MSHPFSDLTIVTRHKDDPTATRLKFDRNGDIIERCVCARHPGTTVTLSDIFHRTPVRRKHLKASSNNHFQDVLSSVQSFALSRTDVKFCVKNTVGT